MKKPFRKSLHCKVVELINIKARRKIQMAFKRSRLTSFLNNNTIRLLWTVQIFLECYAASNLFLDYFASEIAEGVS